MKKDTEVITMPEQEEAREQEFDEIREYGSEELSDPVRDHRIHLMTIIGEIEGHDVLPATSKSTKYEHVLPKLAEIQENREIDGLLLLLNTMGGDVESGLAIAEMVASMSKPSVSLVLGGSHSIGVPLAVSTDYSFIVPTGTMVIHPVRLNGLMIGAPQTYDYFQQIQDRITGFVSGHCEIKKERLEELMLNTGMLSKDLGTVLVGPQTVEEGLIDEVGGICQALDKLHELIAKHKI
jgi:ATP-dependent protease ClpP protease subunit